MARNQHHIELLRIVSCFAVVVIHVSGSNQTAVAVTSAAWRAFNVFNALSRFSVPCFIMISGMFLLSPDRPLTLKALYGKRIVRMLAVLAFWSFFYAAVDFVWRGEKLSPAALAKLAQTTIDLHYHLWYLKALIFLYIATPILRAVTEKRDKKLCLYFIILFLTLGILIHTLSLIPALSGVAGYFGDNAVAKFFCGYAGYYMLGYYLNTYPITRRLRICIYILGVLGAAAAVLVEQFCSDGAGSTSGVGYDFITAPVLFMSAAIFLFFKEKVSKLSFSETAVRRIGRVSSCTFGIYLLHAFVLERLYDIGLTTLSMNPVLAVALIAGAGFLISWPAVLLLKKVPRVGKYLI
jgi:surface polysaccharide O-acyltransferase-like enzyme